MLTSELLQRAQPGIKTIRSVVRSVQARPALWKAIMVSPVVIGALGCVAAGAVTGALIQRARQKARMRRHPIGRLILAITE